jgi:enoyl-CoA hydratase/carnithine racemase
MHYSAEQLSLFSPSDFAYLQVKQVGQVLHICLDRAEKKNALHPQMVVELAFALRYAASSSGVWVVVIKAKGDVFCAGADLKAFAGDAEDRDSKIPAPQGEILIAELFNQLYKPCIALVNGDVLAGGFLILAACTYVIAANHIKLSLPEVKRGLFPFQVMASLLELMPARKVIDWCIRGHSLTVEQALEYGLVTHLSTSEELEADLQELLAELLKNSPTAIRKGLEAYDHLRKNGLGNQHTFLLEKLKETLQTRDAMEGIMAFREKRAAQWTGE